MKRNSLVRCAAWLLALCSVLPMAMSCGANDVEKKPETSTAAKTESETIDENDPYADRLKVSDDLGEYDFNEYVFRIVCTDGADLYVQETDSADVVDSAIYFRNRAVEERFNCKISVVKDASQGDDPVAYVSKVVGSGDDVFDLASAHTISLGGLVPNMYFFNWYDIPNINFDKPWWSNSNKELLTHNNVCFIAIGDLALTAMYQAYAIYYNKRIGADYDMPDMFELVENGEWTIDKMVELSKDIYQDLNLNGVVDFDADMFGFINDSGSGMNAYLWAFDNPIYKTNEKGEIEYVYHTEKLSALTAKLCDTFSIYLGVKQLGYDSGTSQDVIFEEGRAMFTDGQIAHALEFRSMEDDYSILPYPKYDEAQKEYYTMVDGAHHVMAIPVTVDDTETVGTITEALCAESYKILFPAYYDVALKVKGTRDEASIKMLDRIVNSRIFDFGFLFDGWRGYGFLLQFAVARNNKNIESTVKRYEKSAPKWYNSVLEAFENYEG